MSPSIRRASALVAFVLAALIPAAVANAIPSAVVHYQPSLPASLDQYAAPGNVIIVTAQQRERNPARLRAWRARGAIVMAYVNLVDHRALLDPIEEDLYGGAFPQAWKYPGNLSNWGGTTLLNLSRSSPVATYNGFTGRWGEYAARWIRDRVIGDGSLFNGVFLDVWGDTVWSLGIGGAGSDWEAGIAAWGQEIRRLVGPGIYLVGNNTQTPLTAAPLNGRMWESFESRRSGWNHLTGDGNGLIHTFRWNWHRPQLDILWRNEANPSEETKEMLNAAAERVSVTGTDIAVGSSDHRGGFPAPFGRGGGQAPVAPVVPPASPPPPSAGRTPAETHPGSPGSGGGSGSVRVPTGSPGSSGTWSLEVGARTRTRTGAAGVTIIAGRSSEAGGMLWRDISPSSRLTVTTTVRVTGLTLPRGRVRALITVAAADGSRREAGFIRMRDGRLRWALWAVRPDGRRTALRVSGTRMRPGVWTRLRLVVDRRTASSRDRLLVGSRTVVRARPGVLGTRPAVRAGVGAGPVPTQRAAVAVTVKSLRVAVG